MNDMKTKLLLAATVAVITAVNAASAAEPLRSPKAKALADSLPPPGPTADMIDRSLQPGSPKGRELAYSLRTVPSTGLRVNLVSGPRPLLSPKDPRYETALREQRATEFQVAPLK